MQARGARPATIANRRPGFQGRGEERLAPEVRRPVAPPHTSTCRDVRPDREGFAAVEGAAFAHLRALEIGADAEVVAAHPRRPPVDGAAGDGTRAPVLLHEAERAGHGSGDVVLAGRRVAHRPRRARTAQDVDGGGEAQPAAQGTLPGRPRGDRVGRAFVLEAGRGERADCDARRRSVTRRSTNPTTVAVRGPEPHEAAVHPRRPVTAPAAGAVSSASSAARPNPRCARERAAQHGRHAQAASGALANRPAADWRPASPRADHVAAPARLPPTSRHRAAPGRRRGSRCPARRRPVRSSAPMAARIVARFAREVNEVKARPRADR